jgi:nucleoside-diphosphate-sugar epimerase
MRILVIGAAGMLGRKLVERLARDGRLGSERISHLSLVDLGVAEPSADPGFEVGRTTADLAEPGVAAEVVAPRPDVIFHLAAVVSGEAEVDLEKGYRVNLDATRMLFDAIRTCDRGYRPRVVFSSSIAVFGPPFPDVIDDDYCTTPATSYGTQKAMIELLLSDHARRGFLDGVAIRLPTICVRPGKPNLAASGFFSNIIREPLNGEDAVLPVSTSVRHWFASPRSAIGFLLHAATLDGARLGDRRCLTMPGVSATVGEEIDALRRVAGDEAVARIRHEPDETIMRIVAGWPRAFEAGRARALGFRADADFDEIIRVHVEDELGG